MVGSWRPPITEVHGLAPHGQAVRSVSVFRGPCSVIREERRTEDGGNTEKPSPSSEDGQKKTKLTQVFCCMRRASQWASLSTEN